MEEKRAFERVSADLHVLFKGAGIGNVAGRVRDISPGGMFIATDVIPALGLYVLADLDVGDIGKVVWTQGTIVRSTPAGIGVEFTRSDEKGVHAIIALEKRGARGTRPRTRRSA